MVIVGCGVQERRTPDADRQIYKVGIVHQQGLQRRKSPSRAMSYVFCNNGGSGGRAGKVELGIGVFETFAAIEAGAAADGLGRELVTGPELWRFSDLDSAEVLRASCSAANISLVAFRNWETSLRNF